MIRRRGKKMKNNDDDYSGHTTSVVHGCTSSWLQIFRGQWGQPPS